jgi:uncharacterized repeat protein (TIGR01451 family)
LLTFSNGITLQSFTVPIIPNRFVEGDRTFNIDLFNPTAGAQLLPPSTATVTITDNVAGLSFSGPAYFVNENGVSALISVFRTGYTNSTISVDFATADGSGHAGANYLPNSGTLTFTNGETLKTFTVTVIDDGVLNGDQTVLLSLSHLVGNAVLLTPAAATLNVIEADGSLVIPAGVSLLSESGPVNGVIDTNETVTLLFALRNTSGTNTTSLLATVDPASSVGITNPSAPQNYGVLSLHGPSVSRPFTFTANGTNGQAIKVVLRLTDGSTVLSNAAFNFVLGQGAATFSNTAPIIINDFAMATPYPSYMSVGGIGDSVIKATVTLTNLNHTWPSDIDALLVSPTGQKSYLMAKTGSRYNLSHVTLTFDDAYPYLPLSTNIVSGTNHPTSYAVAPPPFPTPAPAPPYATNLAVFNGNNPNGQWSLFIIDDTPINSGIISNGWILNLVTAALVPSAADLAIGLTSSAATVIDNSNVSYSVSVTNFGPSASAAIVISDPIPAGMTFVSSSPAQGAPTNGVLTLSISGLAKDASTNVTIVLQPNVLGSLTNTVSVSAATTDPNPDDNTASAVINSAVPSADLSLSLAGSPSPVLLGGTLTYSITVANSGPASAPALTISDPLPSGLRFLYGSPTNSYTYSGGVVIFTNLGTLNSGAQTSVSIVVQPVAVATLLDTATTSSGILDPFKANNSASVKTVVLPVQVAFAHSGPNIVISWDANAASFVLESTPSLHPATWTAVTNPPPTTSSGQTSVSIPLGSGSLFFRLRAPTQ